MRLGMAAFGAIAATLVAFYKVGFWERLFSGGISGKEIEIGVSGILGFIVLVVTIWAVATRELPSPLFYFFGAISVPATALGALSLAF